MALPIHKDVGGHWRRYMADKEDDEDYLAEQEHPWDKMQQGSRWKLTDERDVPTNLPAWKVYQDTIKGSYSKPNRTLERAKAEAYVQQETTCMPSRSRARNKSKDRCRFTILEQDAKFRPDYMRREKCRSIQDRLRREHFSVDPECDLDEQMERAMSWAAPGKKVSAHRPLAGCGKVTRLDDPVDWSSEKEESPEPARPIYSRKYRRPVDEDDESTLTSYEEWKKAVEESKPKRHTQTISQFEEKVLSKMSHQPGSTIGTQLFVNDATGTCGFLSAVMRTPAYWAKRFEGLESATARRTYNAVPDHKERTARAPSPYRHLLSDDSDDDDDDY